MSSKLDRFKAPKNFADVATSKAELRGPTGSEDIRVNEVFREPDMLMARHGGKYFLVDEKLKSTLQGHVFIAELRAAMSSETGLFIWPVRDNGTNAKEAAEAATKQWTNLKWPIGGKSYTVEKSAKKHPEPEWSDEQIDAALDTAIAGRVLSDPESETVKAILAKRFAVSRSSSDPSLRTAKCPTR